MALFANQEDDEEESFGEIIWVPYFQREQLHPLPWKLKGSFHQSRSDSPLHHLDDLQHEHGPQGKE